MNENEVINYLVEKLDLKTDQSKKMIELMLSQIVLFDKKQMDYGCGNISSFGEFGCLVRCNDKMERLKNLLGKNKNPSNEAIEDSWLDLSNYSLIAVLCRRKNWD